MPWQVQRGVAVLNNWGPRSYNSGGGSTMREEKRHDRNWKEYNEKLVQRGRYSLLLRA
jgi:hypothetical protein